MTNRKGPRYEIDLLNFLRNEGFDVERLRTTGKHDEGDLLLKLDGRCFDIEAKNDKDTRLGAWVNQAQVESVNFAHSRAIPPVGFLVAHKRRMHGIGDSFVTMPLHEWLSQVREA